MVPRSPLPIGTIVGHAESETLSDGMRLLCFLRFSKYIYSYYEVLNAFETFQMSWGCPRPDYAGVLNH